MDGFDSRRPPHGYSVGLMTEYMAEMTGHLLGRHTPLSTNFGGMLYGILATTQLPGSTLLLSLLYLARRLHARRIGVSAGRAAASLPPAIASETQAWQLLVVAIVLSSKILDDHPYTNASWATAAALRRRQLDALERSWLADVGWSLHVDLDADRGYSTWISNWQRWLGRRAAQLSRDLTTAWLPRTYASTAALTAAHASPGPLPPIEPAAAETCPTWPRLLSSSVGTQHALDREATLERPVQQSRFTEIFFSRTLVENSHGGS